MVAMDVVDTLRHQQDLAERELDSEARRERFMARLKELYKAQGIDVPDHVLEQGIDALEQERFEYTPVEPSWRTKLAHIWVSRGRWGKPVGFFSLLCCLLLSIYVFVEVLPERSKRAQLPQTITSDLSTIEKVAKNSLVIEKAREQAATAQLALRKGNYARAQEVSNSLSVTLSKLEEEYNIRVVSRPNEQSGIWRVPPNNQRAKNYYLIVEAIDDYYNLIEVDVLNQENNTSKKVTKWALRVSEATFYQIAADKNDDGIIQNNQVGKKQRGYLEPSFTIDTTGATITEW